jgi:hypothetical protein
MLITDVWFPEPRVPVATVADLQRALARLNVGDYVGLRVLGTPGPDGTRATSVVNLRIGN